VARTTEALDRSRGGFETELHAEVTLLGYPVALELTGSQASDSLRLPGLIAGVATAAVLADKGYDSDANRARSEPPGAEPRIPLLKNRTHPTDYDRHLYRERNGVERFLARVKRCRQVAKR
jgi:transposase